jgi:hypothetical protein
LDHVGSFLDGANLLGPFFVERDFELLFQRHHDFDSVQRIGAQVDKLGVRGDGVEVGAELLGDDASDLVESVGRRSGVDGEAGASLGGNSGGLEVNLLRFKSASVKERREERQCVSIADVKKKRDDPKERER